MFAILKAIGGALAGVALPLAERDVSIGRDETNRIALADSTVSPRHCVLTCTPDQIAIRDLDPTNPSFVNGLPAEDAESLKAKWTLGNNAVFNESYIDDFNRTALRDFVRSLTQKSGGNLRPNVEIETKPDHQKQTVDVVITFK